MSEHKYDLQSVLEKVDSLTEQWHACKIGRHSLHMAYHDAMCVEGVDKKLVGSVVGLIPIDIRKKFISWMQEKYVNDLPAHGWTRLSNAGESKLPNVHGDSILAIREWFAENPL